MFSSISVQREFSLLCRFQAVRRIRSCLGQIGMLQRGATLSHTLKSILEEYKDRNAMCNYKPKYDFKSAVDWVSYEELYNVALLIGSDLKVKYKLGIGDRVGICFSNSVEWFLLEMACALHGFVSVSLPIVDPEKICGMLESFSIRLLFTTPDIAVCFRGDASRTVIILDDYCRVFLESPCVSETTQPFPMISDELPYTIILTSGTTGQPKGVKYTRRMWNSDMNSYPSSALRTLSYLPTSHIVDRHHASTTLFNGGEIVALSSLDIAFSTLKYTNPTVIFITPVMGRLLCNIDSVGDCLHTVVCVAGTLAEEVSREIQLRWQVKVVNPYGLTDIGNIAIDGRILDHIDYKLLPLEDYSSKSELVCGFGSDNSFGELLVKVASFGGYENSSKSSEDVLDAEGFFHTGDMVEVGPNREIRILGRVSQKVKLPSGEWLVPSVIEEAIEAAVAVEGEMWGIGEVFVEARPVSMLICAVVYSPNPRVNDTDILKWINKILVVAGHPIVHGVIKSSDPFTQANGLRNHSMKLNRNQIRLLFKRELESFFAKDKSCMSSVVDSSWGGGAKEIAKGIPTNISLAQRVALHLTGRQTCQEFAQVSFRHCGGDSLTALEVKHILTKELDFPQDGRLVAFLLDARNTIEDVRMFLSSHTAPPIYDRAQFMESIKKASNDKRSNDENVSSADVTSPSTVDILVTGAGGNIGSHVAYALKGLRSLHGKSLRIFCFLRPGSRIPFFRDEGGLEVLFLEGDLFQPKLGLTDSIYNMLTQSIQYIFHCAGNTNQSLDYEDLTGNLYGTAQVLLLSVQSLHLKRVTLLSTTDIITSSTLEVLPLGRLSRPVDSLSGYALMKLKEEEIIWDSIQAGLSNVNICRVGLVCNSSYPWSVKKDFIDILLQGISDMGEAPQLPEEYVLPSIVAADVIADWLVHLAICDPQSDEDISPYDVYHLSNPDNVRLSYQSLFAFMKYSIIPYDEWFSKIPTDSPLYILAQKNHIFGLFCGNYIATNTLNRLAGTNARKTLSVKKLILNIVEKHTST